MPAQLFRTTPSLYDSEADHDGSRHTVYFVSGSKGELKISREAARYLSPLGQGFDNGFGAKSLCLVNALLSINNNMVLARTLFNGRQWTSTMPY